MVRQAILDRPAYWSELQGTPTALLLDQTTPQTVSNGAPVFAGGIVSGYDTVFGNPNPASIEDTGFVGVYNAPDSYVPYLAAYIYDDELLEVVNLPVPIQTGFLIVDLSDVDNVTGSYEVMFQSEDGDVVARGFLPILPDAYTGAYYYLMQNIHSGIQLGEQLIDTVYYPIIRGVKSDENPGLLFGDEIFIYDDNDDGSTTLAFVSSGFDDVHAFQVNGDTGRLTYLSLTTSGLGTLGFDVLGDVSASKPTTAGAGVVTAFSASAKPFLGSSNVGDGTRIRFRNGRQGGVFGATVDTAYFDSVMEDVGETTWESSFKGYILDVNGAKQWLDVQADGTTVFPQIVQMITGNDTNIITDEITIDLSVFVEGLEIKAPLLIGNAYSSMPETLAFPYALGTYDRFAIFAQGDFDQPEILFSNADFLSAASIGANLTDGYFWTNWDWCPDDDDTYSLGASDLRWINGYYSGTVYSNYVDATSGFKVNGASPVADGTYTVGKGSSQDGTITITGGIITAVQEAQN